MLFVPAIDHARPCPDQFPDFTYQPHPTGLNQNANHTVAMRVIRVFWS